MSSSGCLLAVYIRGVRQEAGEGGAGGLPYIRYVKYWTLSNGCIIRSSDCQSLYVRDTGLPTASSNVASMREPLDGSLWWYWFAANAAKKNGASFKNYHRLSHLFYLCGVQIRQSLFCNMRDWSQG